MALAGRVPEGVDRAAVELHLADCDRCRQLVAEAMRQPDDDLETTARARGPRRAAGTAAQESALKGRALGEFVLKEKIGEGGFGLVYRAEQPTLAREAVVKVLATRHIGREAPVQRFLREARLASRIDHPYAAHIYAFGVEADGMRWIAMEYVRGTPLDQWLIRQGPFRPRDFSPLLDRLADVIQSAHERGIVHRDIKPSNVMVLPRAGNLLPKLLDLGVAKLVDEPETGERRRPAAPARDEQQALAPEVPRSQASTLVGRERAGLGMAEYLALTQEGAVIGSPGYMAPELFVDSAGADARSDLYALGVLCYEAVNGKRPFRGGSVTAIGEAHTHEPVPPPQAPELVAFFDKALAKAPGDRFASALELAAAFRSALGLDNSAENLPKLDPAITDAFLAHALEPIAEAVAAADRAENAHQARDAAVDLVSLLARLSAVLALSAWSRTAAAARRFEESAAAEYLLALRRHELSDSDWIGLARALCRPFADGRERHPLPSLIAWLCGDEPDRFESLWHLRAEEAGPGTDRQVREWLARRLPAISQLLGSATFLLESALVVSRGGRAEWWNGVRARRMPTTVARSIPEDRPALLDSDGEPQLLLWPLIQAAVPTQGAAPELFVLEGPGRKGARLRSSSGFLLESPEVWDWLASELLSSVGDESVTAARDQAPYLGLASFSVAEADRYFGREREVMECVNRLQVAPLVSVVGPSGAGKSSFVQAGLIPALPPHWRHVVFRPGPSPKAALARALASLGVEPGAHTGGPVCLVVDQLEEVFTLSSDPDDQRAFAEALSACARTAADPVRVVLTLRDDFLMRAEALFGAGTLSPGLHLLGIPSRRELVRMITEPARRAGFRFEDPNLPEEMVGEVADRQGALPLLSFAAAQLWAERDVHFRRLTCRAYEEMGGVTGALARHADVVVESMPHEHQRLVRETFRHLTTAEGTRAVLSRAEIVQLVGPRGEEVLERLLAALLLTASEGTGADRIEIIHEALIDAWPRLREWRREDAEGARLRDELRSAARQWDGRGRARGLLWRDEALAELRAWRARHQPGLTEVEVAFADTSAAEATRIRRARRALLATVLTGLVAAVAILVWSNARARSARREADASAERERAAAAADRRRFVTQLAEQGRKELLADEPLRALAYLGRARALGAGGFASDLLVAQAVAQSQAPLVQVHHAGAEIRPRFSPDGARFATGSVDGTLRVWDALSGALLATVEEEGLRRFTFSPDGSHIMTTGADGKATLWDARTGARDRVLDGGTRVLQWGTFSPDGAHIATVGVDESVRQWSAMTGALEAVLRAGQEEKLPLPGAAAYSADGSLLAVEEGHGAVRVWDVRSRRAVAVLRGHTANLNAVEFAPAGSGLLVAGDDGFASLWDARTGRRLHLLPHQASVIDARFSPSGLQVVTTSSDRTAVLWDTDTGERLRTLRGHQGTVTRALFGPDGRWIATGAEDATIILWDTASGQRLARWPRMHVLGEAAGEKLLAMAVDSTAIVRPATPQVSLTPLVGHASDVYRIAFSPDGHRIVTAGRDGTARLWDALTGRELTVFRGHVGAIYSAKMSPDGALVATAGGDGTVRLWDVDGVPRGVLRGHTALVRDLAWHPRGEALVSVGDDGTARIWSLERKTSLMIPAGTAVVVGAAFAPSGDSFATVGDDRALRLWRTRDGGRVASFELPEPLQTVRFDGSGRRLLGASRVPPLRVLSADAGATLLELVGHIGSVEAAEWGAGDRVIATAGLDGTVRLWDSATGDLLQSLQMSSRLWSVAISSDGRRLAFAGESPTPQVWTLPPAVSDRVLEQVLRCRVPFEVSGDRIASRKLDRAHCGSGETPR